MVDCLCSVVLTLQIRACIHFNLDSYERKAPSTRPKKILSKKNKKNPKYSTLEKPRKKKKKIYVDYEDELEGIL